ncbi:MAG TPA: hypothetical protein DCY40_04650 [Actinobacteria bacterium]|nr:hypothetical protein [Actinomycetota bacterium]
MAARPRGSGPRRPPKDQPNPWLVGLALALVLGTVGVVAFGLMHGGGGTAAAGTTTSSTLPDGTTTTTLPGQTTTTVPDDGTGATITLPDGGTGAGPIASIGDPIPLSDLKLSSDDIGPLDFGADGDEVLGRLVATFGPPTDDTGFIVGSGTFGECPGWSIRVVNWGPLVIVVRGEPGDNAFVSYRLDLDYGGVSSPTKDIATLSGLRVLDTVAELNDIYSNYSIEFVVDQNVGLTFQLKLTPNDSVLLWGPVDSQAADALVTGIYSPDACDQTAATTTTAPGA